MRGRMLSGVMYTGMEKILVYVISFLQSVVLARLLSPSDFGLTAMLGIFLGLGICLSESGLGTALVICHSEAIVRLERRVFVWNVMVALAIYVVLSACAPLVARWYDNPMLASLMWVMAIGLIINAAAVVAAARMTREERFGRLAFANGVSSIVGASVAIVLAWRGWGVWSIAWMGVVGASVRTVMVLWLGRRTENAVLEVKCDFGSEFGKMLVYGTKLMVSSIIHTFYTESYNLVIGKLWSSAAVGLFVRGNRWARLPAEIVNESVGRIALPTFAGGADKTRIARRFWVINIALLWPGLLVLWIWAPEIVGMVLGDKWLDCVPYMRILIFGQLFTAGGNIALVWLRADGRSADILRTDAWKKPIGMLALLCGVPFGVLGLCWAKVVSDIAEFVVDVIYATRRKLSEPIDLVYVWYGEKDPPKGIEKCRASDNGELYWSIRSVDRFAPWFRNIFVVVNDGTVIPEWLSENKRVKIVELNEIVQPATIKLNNSAAIELWIYRIPGLSERFVYANDDMFLGRPVLPEDFFDRKGRMICRYSGYGDIMVGSPRNDYEGMLQYSRLFLNDPYTRPPHHNMDGYLKSVFVDFWAKYPEETLRSASFRYRTSDQFHRDVMSCFAVKNGRGVRKVCDRWVRLRRLLGMMPYTSLCLSLSDRKIAEWIRKDRPKFFCLNDTEYCTDDDRARVRSLLAEIFEHED